MACRDTTFKYSNLSVRPTSDGRYEVSFDVKNTGFAGRGRSGAGVCWCRVRKSRTPAQRVERVLERFSLKAGELKHVSVLLDGRSLSYYDVDAKQWRAEPGSFNVLVGHSSEQIELTGKLNLTSAIAIK